MNLKRLTPALLAACVLALAACGDDDSSDESASTTESTEAPTPQAADTSTDVTKKPKVTVPKGEPPSGLQIKDLKVGDGATAKAGDTVSVQYVGVSYSTGKQFDASWDAPGAQPFTFTIGAGDVIPGWDQGIPGMKVGGRRQLIIPPDLAYGEGGSPPAIGPNETLIFVVDLVDVT